MLLPTLLLLGVVAAAAQTDDKSAQGRTRSPPPSPPPAKVGYQHAFPQTGPDSPACLDGKAYTITYQLSTSGSTKWSFSIPGGGWCYDELGCLFRANSSGLGQSAGGNGQGAHYKCQADDVDDNCVVLHYCDGSSFASYRAEPWLVPESVAGVRGKTVTFRGIKNLDATYDWAFEHGLSNATSVYIGGASAGGLSTFLHADRLANRIAKQGRPDCTVVANPIDGFFLDHDDFHHDGHNFTSANRYMYHMMNFSFGADGALKEECRVAFPDSPWLCFMAPHMQRFITTPFFMMQSKFDFWQMGNVLALPPTNCMFGRKPCNTSAAQHDAVLQYGIDFLSQIQPLLDSPRRNGGFITSCICHYHCPYGNLTHGNTTASELFGAFQRATKLRAAGPGFVVDPSTVPNNCSFRQTPPRSQSCQPFKTDDRITLMPWLNQRPWKYSHNPKCGGHDCLFEQCTADIAAISTLAFPFDGALGTNESLTRLALAECEAMKLPVMFNLQPVLFEASRLRSNASAVWSVAAQQLEPFVQAGAVKGGFIGDELLWGGLPFADFTQAISLVRASFPRPFLLYANEAWGSVVSDLNGRGQKVGLERIPDELDWFSMDLYRFRLPNRSIDSAAWTLTEKVYAEHIYPKMNSHHRAVLVPGAYHPLWPTECQHLTNATSFGCPLSREDPSRCGICCINPLYEWRNYSVADYDDTMSEIAERFWEWAQRDERVAAIAPWHWFDGDCAGPYELGLQSLPKTRAAYTRMASERLKHDDMAATYSNPVIASSFPDPAVVRLPDGSFAAFATSGNGSHIQCATSADLVSWTMHADALPDLPPWACQDCGRSCAPDVQLHDGVYYMYFLTYLAGVHKRNCIGVATSRTATGPYEPRGDKPIVCDGALTGTAMDPRSFDHEDGSIWLYYGSHHDPIMAVRLAPSRLTLMGSPVPVLRPDNSSYGSVTEGPWVYKDAAGELTMFYSGSQCCGPSAHYAAMAARSVTGHPLGPWEKLGGPSGEGSVVLASDPPHVTAPGHNAVVRDDAGVDWLLYHANAGPQCTSSCPRLLFLDRLTYNRTWNGTTDWPWTNGPTSTPQAAPTVNAVTSDDRWAGCCHPQASNASCWGEPSGVDDTLALQSMMNCSTQLLTIGTSRRAWIASPLWIVPRGGDAGRSGGHPRRVELEEGVVLEALPGAYHELNTAMLIIGDIDGFQLVGLGAGATLHLRKEDYVNISIYRHAEWRMGVWIAGAYNVLIENISIRNSGGDGIYMDVSAPCDVPPHCRYWPYPSNPSAARQPSNIVLRRLRSLYNYRQGLSVIAADGLLIEHSEFSHTGRWEPGPATRPNVSAGTAPAAGLDIEPNAPSDLLKNITIRDSIFMDNAGGSIDISPQHDGCDEPISIRIERCTMNGGGMMVANNDGNTSGTVEVVDSSIANSTGPGIWLYEHTAFAAFARFHNLTLDNVAQTKYWPIFATSGADNRTDKKTGKKVWSHPIGSAAFTDLTVKMASASGGTAQPFARFQPANGVYQVEIKAKVVAPKEESCVPDNLPIRDGVTCFVECVKDDLTDDTQDRVALKSDDRSNAPQTPELDGRARATRGIYWAVEQVSPTTLDFLLGQNSRRWGNTTLSVSGMTHGILQCCNTVAVNRTGHLVVDYLNATQNQLRPGIYAPFRERSLDVYIDVGPVEGAGGLNCTNTPASGSANSSCVTPAQICQAALSRRDQFAAEVLALTLDYNVSGISVDWEIQYGNNQTCFAALWRHVAGVLAEHSKSFAPWVNNAGGWQGPPWYVSTEWEYWSFLPWAGKLLNMGSYQRLLGKGTGSLEPVKCDTISGWSRFTENATGRWCGLEGTIVDMLAKNATPQQIVPAVWMDACLPNGTATKTGWTEHALKDFLDFAASKGIVSIAVWTDGAMGAGPNKGVFDDPGLATCKWFVPILLAWGAHGGQALKSDDGGSAAMDAHRPVYHFTPCGLSHDPNDRALKSDTHIEHMSAMVHSRDRILL